VGSVVLCDRCSGWLGTIWAREKASREREREQRRGVAGGDRLGVARDSEKESRQLRERESRD
jgi:hypothetical protein